MKEINLFRSDINNLMRELHTLNQSRQLSQYPDTCHIKVYFTSPASLVLDPTEVLSCPVISVSEISTQSIKVKIPKISLLNCLQSSNSTHLIYVRKKPIRCELFRG